MANLDKNNLDTLLQECRQCGTCCKTYKKVLLKPDEVERMKKLGANVGVMIRLNDLRLKKSMNLLKMNTIKTKYI